MHGDFEAQRHWMEITTNLPISKWYFYDLEYWGLDYPPLTAYHSWLLGKVGSFINPSWFALTTSHGMEDHSLKLYMRATVIVSEYLIYIPAAVIFVRRLARLSGVPTWEASIALTAILMQPSTILIDHAHFQYNTVMLGFVLASMSSMLAGRRLWGCVFFVAALCFKQMALYYAPAVFAYLVGLCLEPKPNAFRFLAISTVTILAFGVCFAPLLLGAAYESYYDPNIVSLLPPPPLLLSLSSLPISSSLLSNTSSSGGVFYPPLLQLTQSIHRSFPFARGIFEDKVANLWCSIHTFHKLHRYPIAPMQRISLSLTLISVLPSFMTISLFSRKELLPWALASSAWGFFLCSFQVHEKSVLLPLLPMTALLASERGLGPEMRAWIGWANTLGLWTLFPLLKKDELRFPYFVFLFLWPYLLGLPPTSFALYRPDAAGLSSPTKLLHLFFYLAIAVWHGLEASVEPPKGKPDLWVVINVLIGAVGFAICWFWCSAQLILRSGIMEEYFGVRVRLGGREDLDTGIIRDRTRKKLQ